MPKSTILYVIAALLLVALMVKVSLIGFTSYEIPLIGIGFVAGGVAAWFAKRSKVAEQRPADRSRGVQ